MSNIACNPSEGAKGPVPKDFNNFNSFSEQVSQAFAIKLNLKTVHHANQKALVMLSNEKANKGCLKQTLQARAAVYNNLLEPAWFCKKYDLSAKLKNIRDRRQARSMLAGAPTFSAQLGLYSLQTI